MASWAEGHGWAEGPVGWAELRGAATIYEDDTALVLNKPAGISVMGERHGTDLVRMAQEAGETLYPVHRIDKATSGAILFAKELRYHGDLTRQFNRRTVGKAYLAITRSTGLPERGTIDLPLTVGRKNRVRVAGNRADIVLDERSSTWSVTCAEPRDTKSYPSVTRFVRLWADAKNTLLAISPLTGRRHQIRVHLAWIGHPVVGDPTYGGGAERGISGPGRAWAREFAARVPRQFLHAAELRLRHPRTGRELHVTSPLPPELAAAAEWARATSAPAFRNS